MLILLGKEIKRPVMGIYKGAPTLVIQIPCHNEEDTLPLTLKDLPKEIEGISQIEVLVINDGSTDGTVDVAKENGVRHIVNFRQRQGLARAFTAGIDASLKLGADIIVNTDADNQYRGEDIKRLVLPILEKKADIVIGNRKINKIKEFSFLKKKFHRLGSWVIKKLSGLDIPDAATGFRAYTKDAALKLNVISEFTYTLETIIMFGGNTIAIENIEVDTNPVTRPSRLHNSMWEYIKRSVSTLIKAYLLYQPLKIFMRLGILLFCVGFLIGCRFLYYFIIQKGSAGHIQSLILSAILIILGFQVILLGMLADLIAANRRLLEKTLSKIKKVELDLDCETAAKSSKTTHNPFSA